MFYRGYKIIESLGMLDYEDKEVSRTKKERFFTLPWKPWKKTKIIHITSPQKKMIIDKINKRIIMHPTMVQKIKDQLDVEYFN